MPGFEVKRREDFLIFDLNTFKIGTFYYRDISTSSLYVRTFLL